MANSSWGEQVWQSVTNTTDASKKFIHDSLEHPDKRARQTGAVIDGLVVGGIKEIPNQFVNHPKETAVKIAAGVGIGAGIAMLPLEVPAVAIGATVAGVGLGCAYVWDVGQRLGSNRELHKALDNVWNMGDRSSYKPLPAIESSLGKESFDFGLATMCGGAGFKMGNGIKSLLNTTAPKLCPATADGIANPGPVMNEKPVLTHKMKMESFENKPDNVEGKLQKPSKWGDTDQISDEEFAKELGIHESPEGTSISAEQLEREAGMSDFDPHEKLVPIPGLEFQSMGLELPRPAEPHWRPSWRDHLNDFRNDLDFLHRNAMTGDVFKTAQTMFGAHTSLNMISRSSDRLTMNEARYLQSMHQSFQKILSPFAEMIEGKVSNNMANMDSREWTDYDWAQGQLENIIREQTYVTDWINTNNRSNESNGNHLRICNLFSDTARNHRDQLRTSLHKKNGLTEKDAAQKLRDWDIYATGYGSTAHLAGIDVLLVNIRTGQAIPIQVLADSGKTAYRIPAVAHKKIAIDQGREEQQQVIDAVASMISQEAPMNLLRIRLPVFDPEQHVTRRLFELLRFGDELKQNGMSDWSTIVREGMKKLVDDGRKSFGKQRYFEDLIWDERFGDWNRLVENDIP